MGIRKRKPVAAAAKPQQQPQPIDRAFAAEVRRRAEKLAEPVEILMENGAGLHNRQRQQAERLMAELRSEAVRARRLAEHIENLSQETATYKHKWKHTMTDSTIVDTGHKQRPQRRADDKLASSGSQRNFNPLHPSMELPPEQLIRLLGMESKKIRKSRKTRRSPKQAPAATLATVDDQAAAPPPTKPQPQSPRPVDRSIQYEHCEPPPVFDNGRSGLLVPSLLVGVVAGIAISGYLFWYQPEDAAVQKAPAPAVVKKLQKKPLPKRELVKRTPETKQKMTAQQKMAWQASIEAREQQLHAAAKQRLAERVSQQQKVSRQTELQPAPVSGTSPVPAPAATIAPVPAPAIAPEPVSDIVSPVDVTVAIETPEPQESQVPAEVVQPAADTLPVTPGETTAVEPVLAEGMPTSDNAETEEILDIEPAAASAVADIEPETPTPTETDPALTPAAPVDESPVAPADDKSF
jgi:hypothetical protein